MIIMDENKGFIPVDMKISNRQKILNIYRNGSVLTPNQISEAVGLSRQTVSKAIDFFISRGILVSAGKGNSTETGGRKPKNYELSREICFVSVNIDIKSVRFSLFNLYQEILCSHDEPIEMQPSYEQLEETVERGAAVMLDALKNNEKVYGLSVTIRGLVDSNKKELRSSPFYKNWKPNQSLDSLLRFFPDVKMLTVDKPARTFARCLLDRNHAEFVTKRILVIFLDSGMAGAVIDHGHIDHGKNSIIGEFGHMIMDSGQSFSNLTSPDALARSARKYSPLNPKSILLKKKELMDKEVFAAAAENDPIAITVSEELGRLYAKLLRNINIVFDAEQVYMIGTLAYADEHFLNALKEDLAGFVYYEAENIPQIVCDPSPLDEMLVKGAASSMIYQFYKEPSIYMD